MSGNNSFIAGDRDVRASSHKAKAMHWRGLLNEQLASGKTIRTFCKERKINHSTFQYWCDKFFREDQKSAVPKSSLSRFIAVANNHSKSSCLPRVLLPNGVVIDLNANLDTPGVSTFLKELCGVPR